MNSPATSLVHVWPLALLFPIVSPAYAAQDAAACALARVEIVSGMTRADVEKGVAAALGQVPKYSVVANNLRGGTVEYRADGCILEVAYAAGAPAPLVSRAPGKTEHLPARDEVVLTYKLRAESSPVSPNAFGPAK